MASYGVCSHPSYGVCSHPSYGVCSHPSLREKPCCLDECHCRGFEQKQSSSHLLEDWPGVWTPPQASCPEAAATAPRTLPGQESLRGACQKHFGGRRCEDALKITFQSNCLRRYPSQLVLNKALIIKSFVQ